MAKSKYPGVYQRGPKWYADSRDASGKKVRVRNPRTGRTAFSTEEEAVQAKMEFDKSKQAARDRVWTVQEWANEWTTNPGYTESRSESTNKHNAERIKTFVQQYGSRLLEDIDRPTARRWVVANRTRGAAVRAMFGDAERDGIIPRNPFAGLKIEQSKGRKDLIPLEPSEVKLLAQVCNTVHPDWPVPAAMVIVAAYEGLRIGELLGLQWQDVDHENGLLHVRRAFNAKTNKLETTKNKEERSIALFSIPENELRNLPHEHDRIVFTSPRDKDQMSQANFAYHWRPVRVLFKSELERIDPERAELVGDVTFHHLRHFCGSFLADKGATAQDIAEHLGHTDGGRLAQSLYIHTYKDRSRARLRNLVETGDEEGFAHAIGS